MSLAITVFNQIVIMFFIILVGVFCYKIKLIDQNTNKKLSDIVLMLVNPIVIFISYQREYEATLLKGLLISLILAVITHFVSIIVAMLVIRKGKQEADIAIERFAIIYSNCGFIGIPLVNGIFGSEGVFYITAYMTIFNLLAWTHGVITMSGKSDRKSILKALVSPSVLATVFGFIFFLFRLMLPGLAKDALSYIGNMNTPLAMLVAGVTIGQANFIALLKKFRVYYIAFFKLLFMPAMMLLLYSLFDLPRVVLLTSILATACPTAATINLFSIKFDKNYLYASELFAMTTILSMVTIPFIMLFADFFV